MIDFYLYKPLDDVKLIENENGNYEFEKMLYLHPWYKRNYDRSMKRMANKLKKVINNWETIYVPNFWDSTSMTMLFVPVEIICHFEGYILKPRWFDKKHTYYIATTKSEMISFFKKYLDYHHPHSVKWNDWWTSDIDKFNHNQIMQKFIDSWEDGMIFKVHW